MLFVSGNLPQCAIHHLCHQRLACLWRYAVAESAADIWHFESLDTVVCYVGNKFHVVDVKLSVSLSVFIHFAEEFYFVLVEVFPHFLHHPDVTEEGSTQVAVSHHRLLNHAQMRVDQFDNLVLRSHLLGCHLVQLVRQAFQLAFDDSVVYILFAFKICIERTSSFARGEGDIVHRGVFKAVSRKQLSRHVYQLLSCFGY